MQGGIAGAHVSTPSDRYRGLIWVNRSAPARNMKLL
jgi:hypothetical protein